MTGLLFLAPRADAMMQQGHITIRVLENGDALGDPQNAPLVGWGVWVGPSGSYGTDGHPTDDNGQWTFNVMPGLYDTGYMMGMAPYDYPPFQSVSVGPNESVTVTYVLTRLHFDPTVEVLAPNHMSPQPWGNLKHVVVHLTWVQWICEPLHLRVSYDEQHWGVNHEGILLHQQGLFIDSDTNALDLMNHIVATFTGPCGRQGYVAELEFAWDTTWCYNNLYKVLAEGVFNDFWNPSPPGAGMKREDEEPVTLRNVVVKDVAAQPGTSDVIHFDPNAPENDPLRAPQIGFTVEDEGDMRGPYTWKLYLRKLADGNWEAGDDAVISGDAAAPGAVNVTVNSPAEGQTQDQPLAAKGVYAYDVQVEEWGPPMMPGPPPGGGLVVVDEHWAKYPYRLKVPGTPPGFALRLVHNAQGQVEARFDYTLEDTLNAVEAQIELLGPDFGSITTAALDTTVGVPHENELLYTFAADELRPGARYYVVLTGVDQHGVDDPPVAPNTRWYRVRDVNKRMLAVTAEVVVPIDLDADSDNNNGYDAPDRSGVEDLVEDDALWCGKVVGQNTDDGDGDGVPDYADGFDWDGVASDDDVNSEERFVPVVIEVPPDCDAEAAKLTLSYNASDPAAVQRMGQPPPYQYVPGAGELRLWRIDGNNARDKRPVSNGGDYLAPGTYTLAQLGLGGGTTTKTWYVERVGLSPTYTNQRIVAQCDPDGDAGPESAQDYTDAVRIGVFGIRFIPELCHDYIVPGSALNTLTYEALPAGAAADGVAVEVRDRHGAVVRELSGLPAGAGPQQTCWDGLDSNGDPLTEADGPYVYAATAVKQGQNTGAILVNRRVIEWGLVVYVQDRSATDTEFETGVNEATLADDDGNPTNLAMDVAVSGGADPQDIAAYEVTPDTGPHQWDADVLLLDSTDGTWHLLYTTPRVAAGLPTIRYTVHLNQRDPYVQDVAGNEWDMEPSMEGDQRSSTWRFGISPYGSLEDFERNAGQ